MKKKVFTLLMILLVLASAGLLVFFLGPAMKTKESWHLIYIPKSKEGTNDFWTSLISGARMAAEEYGVTLDVMAPDKEQNVEQQEQLFREAVELRPDAILISPSVSTPSPYLEEARQRGIHIVYVDAVAEDPAPELIVSTDNLEVGRKLGEYTASVCDPEGKIAIVSQMRNSSTAEEREQGFREGLGALAENVMEVVYCDSTFEKATRLTKKLMEKYPDLTVIAGLNEDSSVGAARAIRDEGAEDRIMVVGVDSSLEAMELMEQGIFRCIVVQESFKMGYLGVVETIRLLQGKPQGLFVDSGCELVTKENMFDPRIEKLIFPFEEGA